MVAVGGGEGITGTLNQLAAGSILQGPPSTSIGSRLRVLGEKADHLP
jgi:hypothetical protein